MTPALEIRCPSCTQVLARVRSTRTAVGRPFEECRTCRTFVGRPATNEWALMGAGRRALWVVDRVAPYLVIGLVPAALYWALYVRLGEGDARVLMALLAAGPPVLAALPAWTARLAIRRSHARMSDPMYRARLVEFGRRA